MKFHFTGAHIIEQRIGGADEMLVADVRFDVRLDSGETHSGVTRIKQTVGSKYTEKVIEVGPPSGLPEHVTVPYDEFAQQARAYYTETIVKFN